MLINVDDDVDDVHDDVDDDDDGDGGDNDDDNDGEDDDEDERKMVMLMLRTRKRIMLRSKTDPKTGKHTVCEPAQSKCTRTFHRSHLYGNLRGKWPRTPPRPAFCASLRSRNAHGHFTRAILSGNLQGNAARVAHGHRFVRACTVPDTTSIEHRALTVINTLSVATLFGEVKGV